jgi:copper transport protein
MRAVLVAMAALALLPASAAAHAQLKTTVPGRGEALKVAPKTVQFTFSEPVEAAFGAIRVYDAKGQQVQVGETFHPGGKGAVVAIKLKDGLPEGGYTATYRVISADSHPVSSGFVFVVGDGPAGSASVEDLLKGSNAGKITTTALATARGIQYGAIALGLGAFLFFLFAWMPALRETAGGGSRWEAATAAFGARLRRLIGISAAVGAVSAAAGIVLQGATATGTSFWSAANADVVGEVLSTRFGLVWGLGTLAWLLLGGLAATVGKRLPVLRPASVGATGLAMPAMRPSLILLGAPLLALAFLPGLGGHAGVQSPQALLLPTNVVHVVAMAAWLGGIAVLVLALRAATGALEPGDRVRLLAGNVGRFSTMAGVAIAAIAVTGVIQSIVYMSSFGQLLDTAFGRAVLIKSILFLVICGLGFMNRNRLLPQLRSAAASGDSAGRAGVLLRNILRAELATGIAIIGVTGALASYAPSTAVSAGPFSTSTSVGPARLEVTVDPASVGANEMHLYLFDRKTGAQYTAGEEVTVTAELPEKRIAALDLTTDKTGPGHYTVTGATFGVAGDWKVKVAVRVSDFDQYETTFKVPIE